MNDQIKCIQSASLNYISFITTQTVSFLHWIAFFFIRLLTLHFEHIEFLSAMWNEFCWFNYSLFYEMCFYFHFEVSESRESVCDSYEKQIKWTFFYYFSFWNSSMNWSPKCSHSPHQNSIDNFMHCSVFVRIIITLNVSFKYNYKIRK